MRSALLLLLAACSAESSDLDPARSKPPRVIVTPAPDDPEPPAPIQPFSLGLPAQGIAVAPDGNLWFLAANVGLVETTRSGEPRSRIAWGERGLFDYGFTDLAVLDDDSFALTTRQEVFRYRPSTQTIESYFCFVPEEEPIVQENQAITYDRQTGLIHVSPALWDTSTGSSEPTSIRLETYTAADAAWQGAHDITQTGIVAAGMAWDRGRECLWVAAGTELHRFSGGALESTIALDGVTDAQGVLVDGDRLVLLDGATGAVSVIARPAY